MIIGGRYGCVAVVQKSDQPIGVAVSQRIEQNGVNHAENGSIGADPEGQREDGQERESGSAQYSADAVAEVPSDIPQSAPAPGVAARFAQKSGVAELSPGGTTGRCGRQTLADKSLLPHLHVQAHFFLQVAIEGCAAEQHAESAAQFGQPGHSGSNPPIVRLC